MKKFTLRLDESLAKKLGLLAKKERVSVNSYLLRLLDKEFASSTKSKKGEIK